MNTIWALGEYEDEARPAIPILRQQLLSGDSMIRQAALESLSKILPPAELNTLVPPLVQNIDDPDPNLRIVARMLLKEIDPAAAKKAGIE